MRYRALLLKYIEHVASCEGITFLDRLNSNVSETRFDAAEVIALRKLEDQYEASLAQRNALIDAAAAASRTKPSYVPPPADPLLAKPEKHR